jgi:hypothetical protein
MTSLKDANPAPWARTEEPVETDDGKMGGKRITHPAFGMIGASRVSGGTFLYGSDFQHNAFVRITVRTSSLRRDLSTDWPHGEKEVIEVDLSEAQWAEFVSAMNIGFGTQCTIRHVKGEFLPGLPKPARRVDKFKAEANEDVAEALQILAALEADIDALKISGKQKEALHKRVGAAASRFTSSLPFVARQFQEHMEATVSKAKMEINAYGSNLLMKAGLKAIAKGEPPAIAYDSDTPDQPQS